jgi:hypothetical protein
LDPEYPTSTKSTVIPNDCTNPLILKRHIPVLRSSIRSSAILLGTSLVFLLMIRLIGEPEQYRSMTNQ